ncbi:MAG: SLBB domain-containing protein [Desulfuromonadales bacterium]|nr:SLBB domain-containing protein [Desulfuromonadales bacterium]
MRKLGYIAIVAPLLLLMLCIGPSMAANPDYLVGPGDVVKIDVYDHPDLSTVARIGNDGSIIFPLAGKLVIGGMSTSIAAAVIAKKLDGEYIINPQVSVFVEQFKSKKIVIIGEIVKPGLYELSGPTSLLELISLAGGPTRGAGQSATIVRVHKGDESNKETITVNVADLIKSGHEVVDVPLKDGDTVTISKAGVVYVTGQVKRPAAYNLEPDTTVIKAITMAGGFTELASEGKVKIIRKVEGKEQVLEKVSLHEKLMPEDVMVVPESFF